jgi:hypothetical protein
MKSRINLIQLIPTLFVLLLVFTLSCTKENSNNGTDAQEEEVSTISSESDAEAEGIFNGIFDDVMGVNDDVGMAGTGVFGRAANTGLGASARPMACYTVTISHPNNTPFPVRVLIDFGTTSCMGTDGHTRRGKIICEYTNRLILPGAIGSTRFEDFYFDSIKIEGTHKITNTSPPVTTQPLSRQFKVQVIDAKLTRPNGNFVEWNSTKTIEQIEGLITIDRPIDDVFRIKGTARGRARRDNVLVAWESNIVDGEPLIKRFSCRWINKGTIRSIRLNTAANGPWVASLNFGAGLCDNRAILTINGRSHEITLR